MLEGLKGEKEYWEKEHHELKEKVDWGSLEKYTARIEELIKKNNEKYKENQELKDFALKVHNFAFGTKWDDAGVVSAMDFDAIVEEMKKDEREALAQYNVVVGTSNGYADEVLELKAALQAKNGRIGILHHEHLREIAELKEQGKKDLEEAYLETQFHTWRDEYLSRGGHNDANDECEYLNLYSNNQQLIKEIFDEIYSDPTERNLSYNVETRTYDEVESDDEE